MTMATRRVKPPQPVSVDEQWIAEWVTYGLRDLNAYLSKQTQFAAWLKRHNREKETS